MIKYTKDFCKGCKKKDPYAVLMVCSRGSVEGKGRYYNTLSALGTRLGLSVVDANL